ncbi:MAG: hypothetical protein NTX59_01945 [Elusimicrobia bacterium]|nr:hypothetical protein [Elusimicrobiota bacterium]
MTCEEAEKTILYFYGELDGSAAYQAERHIKACRYCSAQIAALAETGLYLKSAGSEPPAALTEKVLELVNDMRPRGFLEILAFADPFPTAEGTPQRGFPWRRTVAASALAVVFAIGFASTGYKNVSWKSDIESRLDAAEYSICQLQGENTSLWQADFDYKYSDLESKIATGANADSV